VDEISILKILEQEGPRSPAELATRLNVPESEVAATVKALEKKHVILGYRTLVDWAKAGESRIFAFIQVNATPEHGHGFDRLGEHIAGFQEVHAVHLMSGTHDLNVIVHGKDLGEIARFVAERLAPLEGVNSTATSFILKSYKIEDVIIKGDTEDRRLPVTP